jgi:hypothetical protein
VRWRTVKNRKGRKVVVSLRIVMKLGIVMNSIIYIVGLVVVILFIAGFSDCADVAPAQVAAAWR